MTEGVSIIIPTFNGGDIFKKNLKAIASQQYLGKKEIIIIDSGSTDGTYEAALESGARVKRIEHDEFHHSRTRNTAVTMANYSKVVMLVQDAVPISNEWLTKLVDSLDRQDVVAAYGQQLPHPDADLFARFESDSFSAYLGETPNIQSIDSFDEFMRLPYHEALRKIRLNNVCAIYRQERLLETPFPDVTFGEDIAWALEIMKQGYKILYQPEIKVHHSHNRTPDYRFRRAIIETIVCSQLLKKVEKDLASLSANDLNQISLNLKDFACKLHNEIGQKDNRHRINSYTPFSLSLLKKVPYLKQVAHKVITILNQMGLRSALIYNLRQINEIQIRNVLQLVVKQYSSRESIIDLHSVIDQAAADVRGRVFGVAYASHKLKGYIPHEIECMVVPYLEQV